MNEPVRKADELAAVGSPAERGVRPRAWWRLSIYPTCDPCVTVREDEAELWRSEGLTVVELGDVAAEREQCAKMIEDYESAGWHGGSGYHAGLKCAARLLRA